MPVKFLRPERSIESQIPDGDVVLATFWKTGPLVASLPAKKGAKAILLQGYETSPGIWNSEIDAVWRLPFHKIVVSRWLVELAYNRFNDSNVSCVPNSVDTALFYSAPRTKQSLPTIGFQYGILHLKGADVSLAALDNVKERLGRSRVIAFGADHVSPGIPLPDWIEYHYRPPQDMIRQVYGQCDVWLCGSRQEGFHLPPLEAMACRCPVVSTRVGGPLDIIQEGVNGFLVDVEDSSLLADRLIQVLRMEEIDWCKMSDAAFATAIRYTWDDATDLLEIAFSRAT